jgi:hypothetical protein
VPDVLVVSAPELRDPVLLIILVKSNDRLLHQSPAGKCRPLSPLFATISRIRATAAPGELYTGSSVTA